VPGGRCTRFVSAADHAGNDQYREYAEDQHDHHDLDQRKAAALTPRELPAASSQRPVSDF
jgi:hypothetical protein